MIHHEIKISSAICQHDTNNHKNRAGPHCKTIVSSSLGFRTVAKKYNYYIGMRSTSIIAHLVSCHCSWGTCGKAQSKNELCLLCSQKTQWRTDRVQFLSGVLSNMSCSAVVLVLVFRKKNICYCKKRIDHNFPWSTLL